jgi:hypothetical protein
MVITDIFTNKSASGIDLPKLSLATFEYYLKKFNLKGDISNCQAGIASIEIYEKYL